jgi:hypothetical protein
LAIVFAMMVAMLVAHYKNRADNDATFELGVFLAIAVFAGLVFCSSIFFRDQQNKAAAMLTHCGVSAGKVWWSRILIFGFAYAIYCIPLVVACLTIMPIACFLVVALLAAIFCLGQMISLYLRSMLAAMSVVLGMFCGFFFWSCAVLYLLGYSGLLWAVWPIVIACLVASRLRAANWQRGRNTWRAWRPSLLTLAAPVLVILCVIPFVRVYSVPTVYLGYTANPDAFHNNIDLAANNDEIAKLQIFSGSPSLQQIKNLLDVERKAMTTPQKATRNIGYGAYHRYWMIDVFAASEGVTPESLKELIAVLEEDSKNRPPLREIVARTYEIEYRDALYGTTEGDDKDQYHVLMKKPLWYRIGLPWEKYRVMRRLDYEFQVQSQLADEIEQLVYHNNGDFSQAERKTRVLQRIRDEQLYEILQGYSRFIGHYWGMPTHPWDVFYQESRSRVQLIQLALQAYYMEHGTLPETLAALEGEYLTHVPTVPVTGDTYLYFPQPDPEFLIGYSPDAGEEYRGVPYLQMPRYHFDRFVNDEGAVYHLNFLKKKIDKDQQ